MNNSSSSGIAWSKSYAHVYIYQFNFSQKHI